MGLFSLTSDLSGRIVTICCVAFLAYSVQKAEANYAYSVDDFDVTPINIVESATKPKVMLGVSNDHQLYFKVYDDYSDLDGDGKVETTYKHSIDYYGYFDSYKCYQYDTGDKRFEPVLVTTDKYCVAGQNQWSGNFLNWASMSRVDTMRKILFGGHRRVDTASLTVLERAYLPHDAHSWAKYYDGADIPKLTPFKLGTDYFCYSGDSGCVSGGVADRRDAGITLGNTTDVNWNSYNPGSSAEYTDPPLIKVVRGNYSLWASNERWQITWNSGAPFDNQGATNGNDPADSGIWAKSSSPDWSSGIGEKNYQARVVVCDKGVDSNNKSLIGKEKCKKYPSGNYKPVGLLHTYGECSDADDPNCMEFGMVAGTYAKHTAGGAVVRTMGNFADEIDPANGSFKFVYQSAGGPITNHTKSEGLVNAWSLFRIVGYNGKDGTYNNTDNCSWGLSAFKDVSAANACRNWGNPFSEIYYQSLHYLAGMKVIGDFQSNMSTDILGLVVPQELSDDPLDEDEYCSQLNIININASVSSYDADEIDSNNYGPTKMWDPSVLPGDGSVADMTDEVGYGEGLSGNNFFVGEKNVLKDNDGDNQLCTSKKIDNLGDAGGLCPEGPRLKGSYAIAGLAYYAHTKDIRPEKFNSRHIKGNQTVDTYSVSMASGLPVLEVPSPNDSTKILATIIPACRNTGINPAGNCAIVDYKILRQDATSGKVFIVWEDSEQGGDFDQDMWGTLTYSLDTPTTISITTEVINESTPYAMAFGYVIGGTGNDGFHAHSGIESYKNSTDKADSGPDCSDDNGCSLNDAASTKRYTLGSSSAKLLEDPLWYAAKWGGFTDSNGNNLPDLKEEWDKKDNTNWTAGSDGIPDNYFYASNPQKVEEALERYLNAILERTSSGTAAAVVSSNVRGEGALYQAYYEPLKKDSGDEVRWIGTVQALWLDSFGYTRQDCSPPDKAVYDPASATVCPATPLTCGAPNGQLDDYCVDNVVETYYDELEARTRVRVFDSTTPEIFSALSMQGIVSTFATGAGTGATTVIPNSMDGNLIIGADGWELKPFTLTGKITAYDATTGVATIDAATWSGIANAQYSSWQVDIVSSDESKYPSAADAFLTLDTIPLAANASLQVKLSPIDPAIAAVLADATIDPPLELTLTLKTKNIIGKSGDAFSEWDVQCLSDSSIKGEIYLENDLALSNGDISTFTIENATADFSGCAQARISTYNMQGFAGTTYDDWQVDNLDTVLGKGSSSTALELKNSGTHSLTVDPVIDWLTPGDRIKLSNFNYSTVELYQISYLWNAREQLTGLNNSDLSSNRSDFSSDTADTGRYIMTWIDDNLDGFIDSGEYRPFEAGEIDSVNYNFFDVNDQDAAKAVVNYVRGIESDNTRNRTIRYSPDDQPGVMRLGDIINSTPTVVGSPEEAFDLLYHDSSYSEFRRQYQNRRIVIYAGSNDGLLHAFNGGFYTAADLNGKTTITYSETGPNSEAAHPLGSELWAYAPKNLLPHLRWLTDSANYTSNHVYYVDGKPRVFDANIFPTNDTTHKNGWGTVMVVGMNLGGGSMLVDADTDGDGDVDTNDSDILLKSAYLVFDITDPEVGPVLLGEIPLPDNSFSTVYPAVLAFRDVTAKNCSNNTVACNKWYLMFGNGPDNKDVSTSPVGYDIANFTSTQSGKTYLFDLGQLTNTTINHMTIPGASDVANSCSVEEYAKKADESRTYHIVSCDTKVANSFVGTPVVVDWQLDFYADTAYFGLVGNESASQGRVMRFNFNNKIDSNEWNQLQTFLDAGRPVVAQPVPALDNRGKKWLFFGTGRFYSLADKFSTTQQRMFGVKEGGTTVTTGDLLNVSDIEVYSDGTLQTTFINTLLAPGDPVNSFKKLEAQIDGNAGIKGWMIDLPQITGDLGIDPSTRNTTRSALLGGVLLTSVFQPNEDECEGEGLSRLYGLYYKTGTAYPDPSVLGSLTESVAGQIKYKSRKFIELGRGVATAPALHSGAGSGSNTIKVFTQLSTGDILQVTAETVDPVRTGRVSWSDK